VLFRSAIAARAFSFDAGKHLQMRASALPFQLALLAEAPLVGLPCSRHDTLRVVGNVGAGWLFELRLQTFADEPANETMSYIDGAWDGGDVRLWLDATHEPTLEGHAHPGARRRAKEAAAADDGD
jgi:hypothetical protein